MRLIGSSATTVTLELTNVEVLAICNALNEVRHGPGALRPSDMHPRLGATSEEVAATHVAMRDALKAMDPF